MEFDEAIEILRGAVGDSHLEGQPYINFTLIPADKHPRYHQAMAVVQSAVARGDLTQDELLVQLRIKK